MQNFKECVKNLVKWETKSASEGFKKDATAYAFNRYILLFLEKISKGQKSNRIKKREPSAYNLFVAEQRAKGKSLKEAIKAYRETKRKDK